MDVNLLFIASYVLVWLLLGFQTLVLLGLIRTVARLQAGPGSEIDTTGAPDAPQFEAPTMDGGVFKSDSLSGRKRAFLFVSTSCVSCLQAVDVLRSLRARLGGGTIVVVCRDDVESCRALAAEYELRGPVVIDTSHEVSKRFGVTSVPTAFIVDRHDRIASGGYPVSQDDVSRIVEVTTAAE